MTDQSGRFLVDNAKLKQEALLSLGLLSVLLLLSVWFYKERMTFIDAPHNLFLIINDGHLHIEEHRYGSFISQLLPFAAIKLHLPLKWIMVLYSISFNLFFLGAGLLLFFRFKAYKLVILLALYLTLFASATFYWPNNEVHQGISWLLLAFGLNCYMADKKYPTVYAAVLFIFSFYLAIWTHPLVMLAGLFLWYFLWLGRDNWPFSKSQSIAYSIVLLILAFIKFNTGMHHGYDSSKIDAVTHFQPGMIMDVFRSSQMHFFIRKCFTGYCLFSFLFVSGILCLIWQKKYLLVVLTTCAAAAYLLLICITFPDGNGYDFYMESEYMPLTIICCVPFIYYLLPVLKGKYGLIILGIIFSIRMGYILQAAPAFTARVALLEKINDKLKQKNISKATISYCTPESDSTLIMSWGAPVESIFISQMNGEKPQRTFIFLGSEEQKTFNTISRDTLLGCWEKRGTANINKDYFQIDTNSTYVSISFSELMK